MCGSIALAFAEHQFFLIFTISILNADHLNVAESEIAGSCKQIICYFATQRLRARILGASSMTSATRTEGGKFNNFSRDSKYAKTKGISVHEYVYTYTIYVFTAECGKL